MSKIEPGLNHAIRTAMRARQRERRHTIRASMAAEPGNTADALPVTIVMRGEHGGLQRHAARRLPPDHRDMHIIDRLGTAGELDLVDERGRRSTRLYDNAQALLSLWAKASIGGSMASSYELCVAPTTGEAHGSPHEDTWHTVMARLPPAYQVALGQLVRNRHPAHLGDALAALDLLDGLTAQHDGGMWHGDE